MSEVSVAIPAAKTHVTMTWTNLPALSAKVLALLEKREEETGGGSGDDDDKEEENRE